MTNHLLKIKGINPSMLNLLTTAYKTAVNCGLVLSCDCTRIRLQVIISVIEDTEKKLKYIN